MPRVIVRRNFGCGAKLSKFAYVYGKTQDKHKSKRPPPARPELDLEIKFGDTNTHGREAPQLYSELVAGVALLTQVVQLIEDTGYTPTPHEASFLAGMYQRLTHRGPSYTQWRTLHDLRGRLIDIPTNRRTGRRE